jgi:hypothetical protein
VKIPAEIVQPTLGVDNRHRAAFPIFKLFRQKKIDRQEVFSAGSLVFTLFFGTLLVKGYLLLRCGGWPLLLRE